MKTRMSLWVVVVALASGWLMKGHAQPGAGPSAPGGPDALLPSTIVATLEMVKPEPQLRLRVENQGTTSARLLRLRPGWLEYNGGSLHDWGIQIEGPGGQYSFPIYTGFVLPPAETDFIELGPGEAFSTLIKVSEASRHDNRRKYPLPQTKGVYTATVSRGALVSNTLQFNVGG